MTGEQENGELPVRLGLTCAEMSKRPTWLTTGESGE